MLKFGNSYVIGGPHMNGREAIWTVKSQFTDGFLYEVSITSKAMMLVKSNREAHKFFTYKCSCESFKEIV